MRIFFLALILKTFCLYADFHVATRCDLRAKYQNLGTHCSAYFLVGRWDQALFLPKKRELYLRLDIPYAWLNCRETALIEVDQQGIVADASRPSQTRVPLLVKENGLSDVLTRAFLVLPILEQVHFGFGTELMFPTATAPELGTGKYRARPMIGLEYGIPSVWTALLAKYEFSFAGQSKRPAIRIFYLQPVVCFNLPRKWLLCFAPEIQLNCDPCQWFVPFAALVGKTIGDHFTSTLEYKIAIVKDFPVFKQETELMISYLF